MDPRMMAALTEAGIPYREGEPLSRHTTMGVGGAAAVMAFPRTGEELRTTLRLRAELGVSHRVRAKHLDGYVALQVRVERPVHDSHTAFADLCDNSIVRKRLADHGVSQLTGRMFDAWLCTA